MNTAEIRAGLESCLQLPEGRPQAQRLESLAAAAFQTGDPRVEADVLLALNWAYSTAAEQQRQPVPTGRLLHLLDAHPAEVGSLSPSIHWQLKWMTTSLINNPVVPLDTVYRWIEEMDSRYRQQGYSPRPVLALRAVLAQQLGDLATASTAMEASISAPRDQMADCLACEHSEWGSWRIALGDDAGALKFWAPVLDGTRTCSTEPHHVLSEALLPMIRTGQSSDARGAHLRGYALVRRKVSLLGSVGRHMEFCALTGNEARGLEILAEHDAWIYDTQVDASKRQSFLGGVCVLLRRLDVLGHGHVPVGTGTVADTLATLEDELRGICGRYDTRNGNTAVSDGLMRRLGQEPLLARLPLGAPARLPSGSVPGPEAAGADMAGAGVASTGVASGVISAAGVPLADGPDAGSRSLDDLVAEARRLTHERHPRTQNAWAAVAACGHELPTEVAAEVARSAAATVAGTDPAAGYLALLDAARLFGAAGNLAGALEARASAAMAQARTGDEAAASETVALAIAEAETAFADGDLTPREYLAIRRTRPAMALNSLGSSEQRTPADIAEAVSLAEAELAIAVQLSEQRYQAMFGEMLARASGIQGDQDRFRALLADAHAQYLAVGEPWYAARTGGMLGELALQGRDPQAAERYAQEGLACGDLLQPELAASLSSLLAQAIGAQPGRELDLIDASLGAAQSWDGISEPDALHNTFNAARTYARLGRFGEAAGLFAEVMPRVHIPYDTVVIAMTHEQYGDALREINRHREAAEEFLQAASLIQDDTRNLAAHARLARAAADALQRSGQAREAIAAYRRAAELFGGLGDISSRVRSLRSAAWAEFREAGESPDSERAGIAAMRAVHAELEPLDPSELVTAELAATRKQLDQMLNPPDEDQ